MLTLPDDIMVVLTPFAQAFGYRIWDMVQVLLVGAILTPGKRTVSNVLRIMGLQDEPTYQNYYRVLNRAKWSGLMVSGILLGLLVSVFVAAGVPLVLGADETLERRYGPKIKAKGLFRDAVRSSRKHAVYSPGLRWISMMLIVPVPWSSRLWALPFLTVLAPSEAANQAHGKRHKTSIDWIMQMVSFVRRCLRTHALVLVTDGGLTAVKLGHRCRRTAVTYVSRIRLDAVLHDWPKPQPSSKRGPKPKKGERQSALEDRLTAPNTKWHQREIAWYGAQRKTIDLVTGVSLWYTSGFDPLPIRWVLVRDPAGQLDATAFLCTDLNADPLQILAWFIMRWSLEVTFQESRAHLGLETQRQWSDLAILRTTPALLGLFSVVTLLAQRLTHNQPLPARTAAWYTKTEPTFSDAIAFVRYYLWTHMKFSRSPAQTTSALFPDSIWRGLVDSICFAT